MNEYVIKHGYKVAKPLYNLVEHEILPGTGIDAEIFWQSLANIFDEFTPKNEALLEIRQILQNKIATAFSIGFERLAIGPAFEFATSFGTSSATWGFIHQKQFVKQKTNTIVIGTKKPSGIIRNQGSK